MPRSKKTPAQLEREIAEVLGPRPINKRKRVRHFSEWTDKIGRVHLAVTYEDRSGHPITREALERFRQHEGTGREGRSARVHSTIKQGSSKGRWMHGQIAKSYGVAEDVVRRIYAAVQTAKKQKLYGGHYADLVEREVGRKLTGSEHAVANRAREHLDYDPPGGYGGPKPKGKETLRVAYDDPKASRSREMINKANRSIKDVLSRRKHPTFGWDETNDAADRAILRQAADELDVAADLFEEAGGNVSAGSLHTRAKYARQGNYRMLSVYDA